MPDLVFKQWHSQIDARTTLVCLNLAGQIRKVDQPFDSLNGAVDAPPAHYGCRGIIGIYLVGAVNTQRDDANAELRRRPVEQRDPRKAKWPPLPPKPKPRPKLRAPTRARRPRARRKT